MTGECGSCYGFDMFSEAQPKDYGEMNMLACGVGETVDYGEEVSLFYYQNWMSSTDLLYQFTYLTTNDIFLNKELYCQSFWEDKITPQNVLSYI